MCNSSGHTSDEGLMLLITTVCVAVLQPKDKAHELQMEKAGKWKYLSLLPALPEDIPVALVVGVLQTQQAVVTQPVVGRVKAHYRGLYGQALGLLGQVCHGSVLHQGSKNVIKDFGCTLQSIVCLIKHMREQQQKISALFFCLVLQALKEVSATSKIIYSRSNNEKHYVRSNLRNKQLQNFAV